MVGDGEEDPKEEEGRVNGVVEEDEEEDDAEVAHPRKQFVVDNG